MTIIRNTSLSNTEECMVLTHQSECLLRKMYDVFFTSNASSLEWLQKNNRNLF